MNDKYCVLQDDAKDCGICSLLSVIKYYQGNVSKEYLRELTKTTNNGVSALNLLNGARALGFEAYGVKGKILSISKNALPVIAHVIIEQKYPHFIVVYKINERKNKVLVMDPAKGFMYYSISDFMRISSGYYIILKPKQTIIKVEEQFDYIEKVKQIILDYKPIFLSIILISLFYTLINIINSYHFKLLYEAGDSYLYITIILALLIIIKSLFNYCRSYLLTLFNFILDKYLVKDAIYHIIHLPYLYYRNHTNGDLLTRINDLGNIKELLSNLFISVFVDLTLAVIVIFFMFSISFKLSIISIITLTIYGIITLINSKKMKSIIQNSYENMSVVNNDLMELLSSFETIKNLSIQNYVFKRFTDKYNNYTKTNKHLFKIIQKESFFKNIILEIGGLLIIYIGIRMVNDNSLSIISLITFITLSGYIIDPIRKLLDLHLEYQNAKESIRRIKEVYSIPKEKMITNHFIKCLHGDIDIDNISYSYNGKDNIISNLSLSIKEGEKILIYGNSGCGKSTLMKLLIKYIDGNYSGNITIGGYDLKDIDIKSLRNNICYVSQNEYLYTNSIYENITLGKKTKYSLFLDVANNLSINEIVSNSSLGYNFVIENNGENISGGERKKIFIARSILQKANIYIYDETFSEMNIELERKIIKYLFQINKEKTIIVISHRFSNEDLFDKKIRLGGENNEFIK